jgi:hypothetical protein
MWDDKQNITKTSNEKDKVKNLLSYGSSQNFIRKLRIVSKIHAAEMKFLMSLKWCHRLEKIKN